MFKPVRKQLWMVLVILSPIIAAGQQWVPTGVPQWVPTGTPPGPYATSTLAPLTLIDSVPCVIITAGTLSSAFQPLADWKTRKGTKTEVKTLSQIIAEYPSEPDSAAKIRTFIQWSYTNRKTEWVLLGGDVSLVPGRYVVQADVETTLTDYYYACLDGNWNADGDATYGEFQDSVDLYPEVYVGRLPVTNSSQVSSIITKLMSYERKSPYFDYQTKALILSSDVYLPGDGTSYADSIVAHLPANFQTGRLNEYPHQAGIDSLNQGFGLIFNYSHAQGYHNFLTVWATRDAIDKSQIDALTNTNRYSVFVNVTCHYQHLEQDALSKHFILNPSGAGVAYICTYRWEGANATQKMHLRFLDEVFDSGRVNLGKAFFYSKQALIPGAQIRDNNNRYMVYAYNLFGDPQMEIWTATPKQSTQKKSHSTVYRQVAYTITDTVKDISTGLPIPGAVVCLKKGTEVYQVQISNANGIASFSVTFPTTGYATLIASKTGYIPDSTMILVASGGGGCPMAEVWDGASWRKQDYILTQSEEPGRGSSVMQDAILLGPTPLTFDENGLLKIQVIEEENEISYLDQFNLGVLRIPPDVQSKLMVTTTGELVRIIDELSPEACVDVNGTDQLNKVGTPDGIKYFASSPGELKLVFHISPQQEGVLAKASTITAGPGGGLGTQTPDKPAEKVSVAGTGTGSSSLATVDVLTPLGTWVSVGNLSPRFRTSDRLIPVPNILSNLINNKLTLRLRWNSAYTADKISFYLTEPVDPGVVEELRLDHARNSREGSAIAKLLRSDGDFSILRPGDTLSLTFSLPEISTDEVNSSFVLFAKGYYTSLSDANAASLPLSTELLQNYPNPFNANTTIKFKLARSEKVSLRVFNLLGQMVITLVDGVLQAGEQIAEWNGKDDQGRQLPSGLYFYQLKAETYSKTKKLIYLK